MKRRRYLESDPTEAQIALERVEELLRRQPLSAVERHWLEEDLRPLREAAKIEDPGAVAAELDELRWQMARARDVLGY